jgi:PKD repeat protein
MLLCYGNSLTLDAGYYFDSYLWIAGDTTQTLTVSEEGWIHVNTTTLDGCELTDSVYIYVSQPVTNLETTYEEGCYPFEMELSAPDGYKKYVWQNARGDTLSTSNTYIAGSTGEYTITVFDKYNCTARSTMNMVVFPVPKTEFSGPSLVCGEMKTGLSVLVTGAADSVWNFEGSTEWTTSNPASLVLTDMSPTSVQVEAIQWGEYEIYYHLKTVDGCAKTDTFRIRFHPQPVSDFILENDERCEGYSQKLQFTGSATDSATFHWDLNGCQFLDTLGYQYYVISVGAFLEEQPGVSLYIDDNGCLSEPKVEPVGALPNFTMDASLRRGCDELTVDFTSTMLTEDRVEFKWEFDDGETAVTPNHTKYYSRPGFYGVKLTVTNPVTQCVNSYKIDSMIKVFPTPVAAISADPQFCHPDSAQLIYTHTIDSSVCFWEFEGMHQIGGENDSVRVWLDDPVATARLIVDEYGCISAPAEIELKRRPRFDLLAQTREGCQPFETELHAETRDANLYYEWITDSLPYPSGDSRFISFPDPGSYDVGLIARSEATGCSDTLVKAGWIEVFPKPEAEFRVNYPVAFTDHSQISFFNRSRGADHYSWDFGDGAVDTAEDPTHRYTEPGEYTVVLIAQNFQGCGDSTQFSITILPSPVHTPNAFRPGSPIEENRTFMPLGTGVDTDRFHLSIYNRQGQLVFESRSPGYSWDGTIPNGKPAPAGNYIWIARYFDIQGIEREQKGQVLLIR